MARPRKTGLDYYPADTGRRNDFKIMDLLNEYGPLGYTIYDFCLQYIYENGYFLKLDADKKHLCLSLTKDIGAKWIKQKDLVGQVIDYCADIGLFDKDLLQQNIMTSVGIQRRYDSVTVRNKVDKSNYWLLEKQKCEVALKNAPENLISATETPQNVAETPQNVAETQQSKVNESKVNKNNIYAPPSAKAADNANKNIFISLPLNDKTFYKVPMSDVEHFKELYPVVNVEQELRSMLGWLENNPAKRKTRSGIKRFINKWLCETQNRGGVGYYGSIQRNNQQTSPEGNSSREFYKGEKVL